MTIIIRLYLQGGMDEDRKDYADIYEYSDTEGEEKWTKVGEMSKARSYHVISVVDFLNFKDHCQ